MKLRFLVGVGALAVSTTAAVIELAGSAPASSAPRHSATLGVYGAATWTVGQSIAVSLKKLAPGNWSQQLWSGTCESPKTRLAALPSLVVPKTRTLRKTTSTPALPATDSGVILRLVHGTSTICGVFIVDPRAKYEGSCEFCFLSREGPLAPVPDGTGGYTYRSGDTRQIVRLDESFGVPAGTTTTFDRKIIIVTPVHGGDISVFGTLDIENSLILWREQQQNVTRLRIEAGGTLIVKDSYSFRGFNDVTNWDYESGSTVRLDHFVGDNWTGIWGSVDYSAVNYSTVHLTLLAFTHDARVNVWKAHNVWLELTPPAGTTHTFRLPPKRQWADWTIPDLWPNTLVDVHDSYIYERDVSLTPNTHVTVADTPSGFGFGWGIYKDDPGFATCDLRDVGTLGADNEHPTYYQAKTWDLPCIDSSLTVLNTSVEKTWNRVWGYVHVRIYNSNFADTHTAFPATEEIYGSSVDSVDANAGGRIYIEDSQVNDYIDATDAGSAVYAYGVTGTHNLYTSGGGTYVSLTTPGPPW